MIKFYTPDLSDKRIAYASNYLVNMGYENVNNYSNSNFTLLPPKSKLYNDFSNAVNYMSDESFLLKNAYLTAESAVSIAIQNSEKSLINSSVLITGFGRISKALLKYLMPFSANITVCCRNADQKAMAKLNGAKIVDFSYLKSKNDYDFVFNTVPFPIFNENELSVINEDALLIDLASFPGGVDSHSAKIKNIKLIQAGGLPGKYSPKTAGLIVANTVDSIIKEGRI